MSLKAKQNSAGGFSLVEMLIYIAIFMVVSTASVGLLISLNRFIDQYRLETILYRSGTGMMEQMLLAVRQADRVDIINTTEDDPDTGRLTVENVSTTTAFTLDSGALDLSINGEDLGDLTTSDVSVEGFTVYFYPMTNGEFVRVKLELTATLDTGATKSETFYGGAVVRGAI